MEQKALSLYELNYIVRRGIRSLMPDEYWVQAELSDVRSNYSGHCYMEFVQKDSRSNSLIAKARGMIWSNVYSKLRPYFERETGQAFVSGISVLVKVTVDFHELYGYSLTVVDIDPTYTVGDMVRRRKEILKKLDEDGVLTLNKELEMPLLVQNIAVISSATAAGYDDFCNQLYNNKYGFAFNAKLFPAVMQGDKVESSIISALEKIYREYEKWDTVVIIRGGGATSDLSGFDTYDLASHCAQFPLPIITGIGHERDDTVLDMISHTRVKTPTAVAEFLINRTLATATRLEQFADYIYNEVPLFINQEKDRLDKLVLRFPSIVHSKLQKESMRMERFSSRISMSWQNKLLREKYKLEIMPRILSSLELRIQKEKHRLDIMEEKIKSASPDLLLKRGYSITLKNGKAVTDISSLKEGDEIETIVSKGKFKSIVCS